MSGSCGIRFFLLCCFLSSIAYSLSWRCSCSPLWNIIGDPPTRPHNAVLEGHFGHIVQLLAAQFWVLFSFPLGSDFAPIFGAPFGSQAAKRRHVAPPRRSFDAFLAFDPASAETIIKLLIFGSPGLLESSHFGLIDLQERSPTAPGSFKNEVHDWSHFKTSIFFVLDPQMAPTNRSKIEYACFFSWSFLGSPSP